MHGSYQHEHGTGPCVRMSNDAERTFIFALLRNVSLIIDSHGRHMTDTQTLLVFLRTPVVQSE
jgi:hypothetical protein